MPNTPSTDSVLKVAHYLVGFAATGGGTTTANFGQVQPKPPKAAVDEVVSFLQESSSEEHLTNSGG